MITWFYGKQSTGRQALPAYFFWSTFSAGPVLSSPIRRLNSGVASVRVPYGALKRRAAVQSFWRLLWWSRMTRKRSE
jgi:hypothetical protein